MAGVVLLAAWIVQGSNSFQSCLENGGQPFDDAAFRLAAAAEDQPGSNVECLGEFLDSNEPTIVALAAIMIAGFTGTLWAATKRMQQSSERLARTADETAQRQLRAYVSGTPESIGSFDQSHPPCVHFRIHNSGATPAHEVRYRASVAVLSAADAQGRVPPMNQSFSAPCVLFPNGELRATGEPEAAVDAAAIAALQDGGARLYCYGDIDYVDAFMHPHSTRFCHEICADRETLRKLASLGGPADFKIEFRIAPFGNTAS